MAYYTRPEEVLQRLIELCNMAAPLLGIKYVATQDETLIPEYPAIQVAAEPVVRELHGTYTFENTFVVVFWVYHANLQVSLAKRTIEDMQLATRVVDFLHRPDVRHLRDGAKAQGDPTEGDDKVIFSYVSLETPGMLAIGDSNAIVTTRLLWLAEAQERFAHG